MLRLLSEDTLTAFQVCRRLFPAVYENEMFLTLKTFHFHTQPETAAGIPGKPSAYPLTTGAAHIPTGFSVFQAACQKLSETIGHLDVLAAEGKAVSFQSGNTLMFKAVKG